MQTAVIAQSKKQVKDRLKWLAFALTFSFSSSRLLLGNISTVVLCSLAQTRNCALATSATHSLGNTAAPHRATLPLCAAAHACGRAV